MLTHEQLVEKLDYDESTGLFVWKSGRFQGKTAGSLHYEGYVKICLLGKHRSAHRLAWMYVHKHYPTSSIDHVNGNKSDNRICNLRMATGRQNSENRVGPTKHNSTGFLGVTWSKEKLKFVAKIVVCGKSKHLGTFDSPKIAHEAYLVAKRKYHEFCSI